MELTEERNQYIDSLDIYQVLEKVRYGRIGDEWMTGQTGERWMKRMSELREQDPGAYVQASKSLGWER